MENPLATVPPREQAAEEIRDHKWFFWTAGVLSVIVGCLAILVPQAAALAAEVVIGAVFVASGIVQVVAAFRARRVRRVAAVLFMGLVSLAAGVLLLVFPLAGVLTLALFLAAYFAVTGAMRIYFAWRMRPVRNWGWLLAGGIVTLLLGLLIWSGLPGNAAWVLGLIVGIDMVFFGFTLIGVVGDARDFLRRHRERREAAEPEGHHHPT